MKKRKKIFLVLILVLICILITMYNQTYAVEEYYKDWSEFPTEIDTEYSYSTLYYSADTKIEVLEYSGSTTPTYYKTNNITVPNPIVLHTGQEAIIKITNCAVDTEGNICDVVIKLNNVKEWGINAGEDCIKLSFVSPSFYNTQTCPIVGYETESHYNSVQKQYVEQGLISVSKDKLYDTRGKIAEGELINLLLTTVCANCDFSMTYYKAGTYTYDKTNKTGKGNLAKITKINNFLYDIDIPKSYVYEENAIINKLKDKFLEGNEGIQVSKNNSINGFYYCKNASKTSYPKYSFSAGDRAFSVTNMDANCNGIYYQTSAFVMANLEDATYTFTYGGAECGITFSFMSPNPYAISSPTKSASVSKVSEEEIFNYKISQYIPNNYYTNIIKFSEIYTNFKQNSHYSQIQITDELNENLTIKGEVKIFNEKGEDVSSYFKIVNSGNKVTATLAEGIEKKLEFYSHTYTMNIPVCVNKGTGMKLDKTETGINNIAKAKTSINGEETNKESNEIKIALKYKVTTKIQNGEFITPSSEVDIHANKAIEFKPKAGYIITSIKIDDKEIENIDEYIDGGTVSLDNIVENHDVVVTCSREVGGDVIVKYVDENGEEIAETEILKGNVGEEYKTEKKEIKNYEYKDVEGASPTGVFKRESQEIVYHYTEKNKSQVIVKYEEITTHESVKESMIIDGYVGDEYVTEVDKNIEGYVYIEEKTPENANGIITDSTITVTYYYKKKTSVITRFVDKATGKEIADQVIQNGYIGDEYTTEENRNIEEYDYIEETPENASGTMKNDTTVVTYYYRRRTAVVIKYVDKATGKEIADREIKNGHVGDEYETKEIEIEGYEFIETTENSKGIMTEEQITVNYYYKEKVIIKETPKEEPKQEEEAPKELPAAGNEKMIFALTIVGCIIISFIYYKGYKRNKDI